MYKVLYQTYIGIHELYINIIEVKHPILQNALKKKLFFLKQKYESPKKSLASTVSYLT